MQHSSHTCRLTGLPAIAASLSADWFSCSVVLHREVRRFFGCDGMGACYCKPTNASMRRSIDLNPSYESLTSLADRLGDSEHLHRPVGSHYSLDFSFLLFSTTRAIAITITTITIPMTKKLTRGESKTTFPSVISPSSKETAYSTVSPDPI